MSSEFRFSWRMIIMLYDDRSGSTLLASRLAEHPEIAVTIEGDIFREAMGYSRATLDQESQHSLIRATLSDTKVRDWRLDSNEVADLCDRLAECGERLSRHVVQSIIALYVKRVKPSATICVIKHGDVEKIAFYRALLPDVHFIHIYRDGRAVYASKCRSIHSMNGRPMADDTFHAALMWKYKVSAPRARCAANTLLEVKYEDLLAEPNAELERIFEFAAVTSNNERGSAELGASRQAYSELIPQSQKHLHSLVQDGTIQRDRERAWESELDAGTVYVYEKVAGKALRELGYRVGYIAPASLGQRSRAILKASGLYLSLKCRRDAQWLLAVVPVFVKNPLGAIRRQIAKRRKNA